MHVSSRQAELDRKKARLQVLREEKERRRLERQKQESSPALAKSPLFTTENADIDEMLSAVGVSTITDVLNNFDKSSSSFRTTGDLSFRDGNDSAIGDSLRPDTISAASAHRNVHLSVVNVNSTNIAPTQAVTYSKQTQTDSYLPDHHAGGSGYYVLSFDDMRVDDDDPSFSSFEARKLPPGILHSGMPVVTDVRPAGESLGDPTTPLAGVDSLAATSVKSPSGDGDTQSRNVGSIGAAAVTAAGAHTVYTLSAPVKSLSDEERDRILQSVEFGDFLTRKSRVIERLLAEDYDACTDYHAHIDDDLDRNEYADDTLNWNRTFFDERLTRSRCVTAMNWSTHFPELLLSSYSSRNLYSAQQTALTSSLVGAHSGSGGTAASGDYDGLCLIWNTRFRRDTPEYTLCCQSSLTGALFSPFHPSLVVGATYSGRVLVWDTRLPRRTPVQRSSLSSAGHTHPVCSMKIVGTQNAHNLVSISSDGKLRTWSLEMLAAPVETQNLQLKQGRHINPTCMDNLVCDLTTFVFGAEDGCLYTCNPRSPHQTAVGCALQSQSPSGTSHQTIVSSVSCMQAATAGVLPGGATSSLFGANYVAAEQTDATSMVGDEPSSIDVSRVCASAGYDRTLKLWLIGGAAGGSHSVRLLHTVELVNNSEYVASLAWSPVHPSLLACAASLGVLELYQFCADTEVPVTSVRVTQTSSLSALAWTGSHGTVGGGRHLCVGDDQGSVYLYDVGERLASPGEYDLTPRMSSTLARLSTNQM